MPSNLKYVPIFRSRQQEIIVLKKFDFENHIYPLIEVVKEKDRKNRIQSSKEFFTHLFEEVKAEKILVDLPVYIREISSMQIEVIKFRREIIQNLQQRINFFNQFKEQNKKVIPVISSLLKITDEENAIQTQFNKLKDNFSIIAFRTFHDTLEKDQEQIQKNVRYNDILIYDLDKVSITSSVVRKHRTILKNIKTATRAMIRSAINTDIQNVKLDHGEIVAEADNSLVELYSGRGFNAFGDYVGIKKDDLSSGGTISPGFIIYDPYENEYYGYRGSRKSLDEFKNTIVPAVLQSEMIATLDKKYPQYLNEKNSGFTLLKSIQDSNESGKSQAKFKRISMEHYLHCIKTSIKEDTGLPLSESINN